MIEFWYTLKNLNPSMSLEVIKLKIQNVCCLYFLLIIMGNDGWMVNGLVCHHGDDRFNSLL